MVRLKRVYATVDHDVGARFLVDRLWPRGLKKEQLRFDGWYRDVAPSNQLRSWFGHDPGKWEEFKRRYFAELDSNPAAWRPLFEAAREGDITLLYAAKDENYNNAVALKDYLEAKLE